MIIRLFGAMEAEWDGTFCSFPSRKAKDLFAYLLLHRQRPQPREHLAAVLWAEADQDKARHCLNTVLWRLRRVLGPMEGSDQPVLRSDAQSIGINAASSFQLDVAEFESYCRLAAQAGPRALDHQAEHWRRAIGLYSADLLPECYDDWCLVERERLQALARKALSGLLTYHAERHEYDEAIGYAQRLLAIDPLRESVHRALIKLYLAVGQPATALRQYRLCEETVGRELGMALRPETQALLPRLLGDGPSLEARHGGAFGVAVPKVVPSSQQGPDLVAALARLQDAITSVDRARADFAEASALVAKAQRLLDAGVGACLTRHPEPPTPRRAVLTLVPSEPMVVGGS